MGKHVKRTTARNRKSRKTRTYWCLLRKAPKYGGPRDNDVVMAEIHLVDGRWGGIFRKHQAQNCLWLASSQPKFLFRKRQIIQFKIPVATLILFKKDSNRHFSKEAIHVVNKHMKNAHCYYPLEKCRWKPWWDTTHLLGWLQHRKWKERKITSVEKNMEKLEPQTMFMGM